MDRYCERRIVSWIAHHLSRGKTRAEIDAINLKRRPPFAVSDIEGCFHAACCAVNNVDLIRAASPTTRICDIPGIALPKE